MAIGNVYKIKSSGMKVKVLAIDGDRITVRVECNGFITVVSPGELKR